jgi:hypothetical protein
MLTPFYSPGPVYQQNHPDIPKLNFLSLNEKIPGTHYYNNISIQDTEKVIFSQQYVSTTK